MNDKVRKTECGSLAVYAENRKSTVFRIRFENVCKVPHFIELSKQ